MPNNPRQLTKPNDGTCLECTRSAYVVRHEFNAERVAVTNAINGSLQDSLECISITQPRSLVLNPIIIQWLTNSLLPHFL